MFRGGIRGRGAALNTARQLSEIPYEFRFWLGNGNGDNDWDNSSRCIHGKAWRPMSCIIGQFFGFHVNYIIVIEHGKKKITFRGGSAEAERMGSFWKLDHIP